MSRSGSAVTQKHLVRDEELDVSDKCEHRHVGQRLSPVRTLRTVTPSHNGMGRGGFHSLLQQN